MIEPYLVQELENGGLSLSYQKVGEANVQDFYPSATTHEKSLIRILQKFSYIQIAKDLKIPPNTIEAHLSKLSHATDVKSQTVFALIKDKASQVKSGFFSAINGTELLYETRKDGYPAGSPVQFRPEVFVKLNYNFLPDTLIIKPVISASELQGLPVQVLDDATSVVLIGQSLVTVSDHLKTSRLKPFATKPENSIQQRFIKEYIKKFVLFDLQNGLATLSGNVRKETIDFSSTVLYFSFTFIGSQLGLFHNSTADLKLPEFLNIDLSFLYGEWKIAANAESDSWRYADGENPYFQNINRDSEIENQWKAKIEDQLNVRFNKGVAQVSFAHFRDFVLPLLKSLDSTVKVDFSQEFRKLVLKPSKLKVNFFEKINYFQVEGTIDWDGFSININDLKNDFQIQNGWLKSGDQYLPVSSEDQLFLSQIFNLSTNPKSLSISRKAALAIQQSQSVLFVGIWERLTAFLPVKDLVQVNVESYSPNFTLREYQKKGLEWMINLSINNLGGILADDMGLGKTFQTASYLLYQFKIQPTPKPVLIVMPSTLIFNWQFELKRFSSLFKVYLHSGPGRAKDLKGIISYCNVILVSYQTLARDVQIFAKVEFSDIIVDEAHNLKNAGTSIYKAVQAQKSDHIFLLTGTPLQNSPLDLWSLSELCNPGLLSQKLKPQSLNRTDGSPKFFEKLTLMQSVLRPLMLRRTKDNVLSELPEKTISTVYCTMSEDQEIEYLAHNQLIASAISDIPSQNAASRNVQILKGLTTLRLLANHPLLINQDSLHKSGKFDLVTGKLEEVLSEGHKVLIFSSFVKHLNVFTKHLESIHIKYSILTGQTKDRERQVSQFKTESDRNVFLISLKAGGVGLNLVEASYVFLLDPWWNPAAELQAMDRVHRIGQTNPVSIFKFITTNTVEEKILQLQQRKQAIANQIFDMSNDDLPKLTIESLQEILLSKFG